MKEVAEKNLRDLYLMASEETIAEGKVWYNKAHIFCSELATKYNKTIRQVAGIMAALSPMKEWELNKRMTSQFLELQTCGTFGRQLNKSLHLYESIISKLDPASADLYVLSVLNGMKTKSFYHNIVYPDSSTLVTVDTHMLKLGRYARATDKNYLLIQKCIQEVASEINLLPLQLQAIVWLQIKKSKF